MSTTHHGRTKGRWRKIVSYVTRDNPNPNSSKIFFDLTLNCGHVATRLWPRGAQVGKGSECNVEGCKLPVTIPVPVPIPATIPELATSKDVTKSDPRLKPCPFCNFHTVANWLSHDVAPNMWCVFCPNCNAEGPHSQDEELAIYYWNVRYHNDKKLT